MTRWAPWVGGVLLLALAAGCGGKAAKPTPASTGAVAAARVVAELEQALRARDVAAVAGLWEPAQGDAARERARTAFGRRGAIEVRLSLIGLRMESGRRLARVAWQGTWGGEPVSGSFEMELSPSDPPRIVAIRGEDPTGGGASGTAGLPVPAP